MPSWADQLLPQLLMEQFDTFLYNVDTLNICMKEFGSEKIIFDKMTAMRTWTIFPLYGFCICVDSALMGLSTPTTAFYGAILYVAYTM